MWNNKFELPDKSYSVSHTQDYFGYIIKENKTVTDNHPITIYVNKIEHRITFKIEGGYYLELLTPETMNLLGSTKNKTTNSKKCENVPHLGITEVLLST